MLNTGNPVNEMAVEMKAIAIDDCHKEEAKVVVEVRSLYTSTCVCVCIFICIYVNISENCKMRHPMNL